MYFMDEFAVDLGTANTLVYNKKRGLVYNQPSVVAINISDKSVIAIGNEAKEMLGRTNKNIATMKPLIDGVISEYQCAAPMIKAILKDNKASRFKRRLTISVPSGVSEIEMRAVIDLGQQLGFSKLEIIDEPIAAALGEGVLINDARGSMIVDVGAGTTDIAIISLGSIVVGNSIKVAGDNLDEAIIKLLKENYKLEIGKLTAEKIKIQFADYTNRDTHETIEVTGLNILKGVPETKTIDYAAIELVFEPIFDLIVEGIHTVLESTQPELVADVIESGIILTGGGSINKRIISKIELGVGVHVIPSKTPLNSVGNGLLMKLKGYKIKEKSRMNQYRLIQTD